MSKQRCDFSLLRHEENFKWRKWQCFSVVHQGNITKQEFNKQQGNIIMFICSPVFTSVAFLVNRLIAIVVVIIIIIILNTNASDWATAGLVVVFIPLYQQTWHDKCISHVTHVYLMPSSHTTENVGCFVFSAVTRASRSTNCTSFIISQLLNNKIHYQLILSRFNNIVD